MKRQEYGCGMKLPMQGYILEMELGLTKSKFKISNIDQDFKIFQFFPVIG